MSVKILYFQLIVDCVQNSNFDTINIKPAVSGKQKLNYSLLYGEMPLKLYKNLFSFKTAAE
jgi:hypothetical protein